jgi:hypothetical protein
LRNEVVKSSGKAEKRAFLRRETDDVPLIRRLNDQYLLFSGYYPDVIPIHALGARLVWGIIPNKKPHC